jgi:hypothetical protein
VPGTPSTDVRGSTRAKSETLDITGDAIVVDECAVPQSAIHEGAARSGAESVVLVAVSAGEEVEREAQRRWEDDKPDEYFFLEVFGSAVVEHLVMMAGARLCAMADVGGLAVLPHYSPGYPDWDIADQAKLFALLTRDHALPGTVSVLESGMLRPKKSLFAVFGLTRETDRVRKLTDLIPCQNCTLPGCEYRRAPYLRPRRRGEVESMRPIEIMEATTPPEAPLQANARYFINAKALKRWTTERLSLVEQADGTIDARFPLRRHHLQQHGTSALVPVRRADWNARRSIQDSFAGMRANTGRRRLHVHVQVQAQRSTTDGSDRRGETVARTTAQ